MLTTTKYDKTNTKIENAIAKVYGLCVNCLRSAASLVIKMKLNLTFN